MIECNDSMNRVRDRESEISYMGRDRTALKWGVLCEEACQVVCWRSRRVTG